MGIYSRNREELSVVDLACLISAITIVPFYDTLGKDALSFVINQTLLQTMCIEKKNLDNLLSLSSDAKIPSLKNVVIFEGLDISEEQK